MFNPDGNKRITFADIRDHPIFKQHFPTVDHQSRILYNKKKGKLNRYDSFIQEKMSKIQPKGPKKESDNIEPNFNAKLPKSRDEK